jgi:hypothetical protein
MQKRKELFTHDHPFEEHHRWLTPGTDRRGHHEIVSGGVIDIFGDVLFGL